MDDDYVIIDIDNMKQKNILLQDKLSKLQIKYNLLHYKIQKQVNTHKIITTTKTINGKLITTTHVY